MEESTNTGVTTEGSASSAAADSGSPVVPQTTDAQVDSTAETPIESAAPPAADQIPENDEDLANLSETERTPLINQRNRIRELNKWRTEVEPLKSWIDERGGLEYVRSDAELMDKLFSEKFEDRQQFYSNIAQDSVAFERFMTDVATDPTVQREVLNNMDPRELLSYVQQAGLLPSNVDPAVRATIPNELQAVFNSLPPAVQDEYALMAPEVRDWNLRRDAQLYNIQHAERQRQQQQRTHQAYEQKSKVYNDVRSIIQQALTEKIPGNDEATKFVLYATETMLYQSEEGAALWNELEAHIDGGEMRAVRQKLPLLVAKAKAIATQQAVWLNERESKARQFDELMRLSNYDDIIKHVNQLRGGMKQPGPGTTPQPANGNVPKPDLAGQYARENVLSYFPGRS
jgi:hypothetical protein